MREIDEKRWGICRHTGEPVEQIFNGVSDDALDEKGWLCLHD